MPYFPYGYFPIGKVTTTVTVTVSGGGGGPIVRPTPVQRADGRRISGLFAVTPRGGKSLLYLTRGDISKVQSLALNALGVAVSGGEYRSRPIVGKESSENRGKRFLQEGSCAPGTFCTATLTLTFDRSRTLTFTLRGPYDRNKNILFYQELRPEVATFEECTCELTHILGLDVELEKQRLEYTERG